MAFEKAKRVIYKNNPLVQVICQLRFPRILSINEKVPADFQDSIRKDYPVYAVTVEQEQQVTIEAIQDSVPKVIHGERINNYTFSSADGIWQINLTSAFLSLSTSRYTRWEDFCSRLKKPLNALNAVYSPAFYERIGLRYIDAYRRSALNLNVDTPWAELIKPFALGFLSSEIAGEVKGYSSTSDIDLGNGAIARVVTSMGFVGNTVFQQNPELSFIVDSDFFYDSKKEIGEFDVSLDNLHNNANDLIRSIITDKLHEAMGPESI